MAINLPTANSADTLSLFFRSGEDKRLFNTNSDSIFTFGDFRIYRDNNAIPFTSETLSLNFDTYANLESLGTDSFKAPQAYSVNYNELNLPANDPFSYSYFGSFYTEVANSINTIMENFPYAILAYGGYSAFTIYDYTTTFNTITGAKTAKFKIPYSVLINQGNLIVSSGSSIDNTLSLVDNFQEFAIQMSAQTSASTNVINIISYNFSAGTNSYLEFITNDYLEFITGTTSYFPVYIRPTRQRFAEYKMGISKLEFNLLYGKKLLVPDVMTDTFDTEMTFVWPNNIDGFSPNSYGSEFTTYKNSVLKAAADIDDAKTNIMLKTMIPENYTDMDSPNAVYKSTVQAYAHEFDQIKHYIDGIAYAHSIQYDGEETVPQKFMYKFSNLLGWKLSDAFNEIDLFEYLAGDADGNGTTFSQFNIEIWKRILININWLYKKKGTRDALQFIFKLLGAPDTLIHFDEFTYKINQVINTSGSSSAITNSPKINENGYINYAASTFAFQEGGTGRGNGRSYINQWMPEFNPDKKVDNVKIVLGDVSVNGSENTINSKELYMSLDPAAAIESDVFDFYKESGTCWVWGSPLPPFSANSVPFEYSVNCDDVQPDTITGMTLSQWLDYVYSNSIDPRTRKVIGSPLTSSVYPLLRNAYLNYYYWTDPVSHRLTFHKLDAFLTLIERNFTNYTLQLLPATTILQSNGTVIRNTEFNRQKFVYKAGLNDGSEFRIAFPPNLTSLINPVLLTSVINNFTTGTIIPTLIIGTISGTLGTSSTPYSITSTISTTISTTIGGFGTSSTIIPSVGTTIFVGPPIGFPATLIL